MTNVFTAIINISERNWHPPDSLIQLVWLNVIPYYTYQLSHAEHGEVEGVLFSAKNRLNNIFNTINMN